MPVNSPSAPPFNSYTFIVLCLVLVGAWTMLWYLTRRWTQGRRRERLRLWGRTRQLKRTEATPKILQGTRTEMRVVVGMASETAFACKLRTSRTPASRTPQQPSQWNTVGIRCETSAAPQGLRPSASKVSVLDLFTPGERVSKGLIDQPLLSFPSERTPEAFVAFGTEGADVRAVVSIAETGLLPEDVGLLLGEGWLVLDFSSRPFDELELAKMWELAERLCTHLAAVAAGQRR